MSWQQLLEIEQERRALKEAGPDVGDVACPNDGQPLTPGPDGKLFCRFDGWRPE